jgi:membrane protease YdiL (CAAX protease family)
MRSVWLFFGLALGGTWLLQLPAVLGARGVLPGGVAPYMLPAALAGFGPLVAAIVAARLEGPGRVRELFASLRPRASLAGWYLLALLAFPMIHLLGESAYRLASGRSAGAWLYLPSAPQQWLALVMMPLVEEPGWRGFAMPRLAERYGWLRASWLVGVAWAAWHAMMFVLQGFDAQSFVLGMIMIVAGSVVFGWLFARTRGSLLAAVIAHAGVHLDNPTHALPGQPSAYAVFTAAVCAAAAVIVVLEAWRRGRLARHSLRADDIHSA